MHAIFRLYANRYNYSRTYARSWWVQKQFFDTFYTIYSWKNCPGHFHEQSRADRDDYVEVQWENVKNGAVDQFEKYSLRTLTQLDLPYDYELLKFLKGFPIFWYEFIFQKNSRSIMHYGSRTFSRNGRPTLKALRDNGNAMGQRRGFSRFDLMKLNKLYNCPDREPTEPDFSGSSPGQTRIGDWYGNSVTSSTCGNFKWHCFFWKWIGYCKTHEEYMRE